MLKDGAAKASKSILPYARLGWIYWARQIWKEFDRLKLQS